MAKYFILTLLLTCSFSSALVFAEDGNNSTEINNNSPETNEREASTHSSYLQPGAFAPTQSYHDDPNNFPPEPCSIPNREVIRSKDKLDTIIARRVPKSCQEYDISKEFIPSTNATPQQLFRAGVDAHGQNLYICKARINGQEYFGRGTADYSGSKCWLDMDSHEVDISRDFYYMRQPQGVRLMWSSHPSKVKNGLTINDVNNVLIVGRTIFQTPLKDENIQPHGNYEECVTHGEEVIIPGFVNLTKNEGEIRFTYGSRVYTSPEFMVLTCANLK